MGLEGTGKMTRPDMFLSGISHTKQTVESKTPCTRHVQTWHVLLTEIKYTEEASGMVAVTSKERAGKRGWVKDGHS